MEKTVQLPELNFQLIVESAPNVMILVNKDGSIAFMNSQAEKLFGYTGKELIGQAVETLFPTRHKENLSGLIQPLYTTPQRGEILQNRDFIALKKDGTEFPVEIALTQLETNNGMTLVVSMRDITERKQAYEKIDQNEKHFRSLIENNLDIISLLDEKGNVMYYSPSGERMLGYSLEEVIGKPAVNFFHPDDRADLVDRLAKSLKNPGVPMFRRNRMRHKDGHYIWTEGTTTNFLEDENVRAFVGNFRDITESKLAEEKIIHANRLYAFITGINQTIVHATDERQLFKEACRIAVEVGNFKIAWVGKIDTDEQKINIIEGQGMEPEDIKLVTNATYEKDGVHGYVIQTGSYYVCNDIANDIKLHSWHAHTSKCEIRSCMVLPIKNRGVIPYTLNLYSSVLNLFDAQEILLLKEVAADISFALDLFEKDRQRKEMEEQIIHSESRLKQAQAIAHLGSWEFDFNTGTILLSQEACSIYGLPPEDNIHTFQSYLSYIHPGDLDFVLQTLKHARETFTNCAFHHRIVRKDGEVRYIYSQAQYEFNNEGKMTGLYGVEYDETEVREAQLALEQSETNLRLIMDLIPQSIFAKDGNGKFVFVNKSFAALYGLTPDQLIYKNIQETIPLKEEALPFLEADRDIMLSGETKIIPETIFTNYKGEKILFEAMKVPFTVVGTNEKAVLGILIDVTEQKQRENERTKIIADIVQRNKDLEQFSYIVSHNLRAPVANINGIAEVLALPGLNSEDENYLKNNLFASVKKLDQVILDLNYILQLKEGMNLQREHVKLSELLDDIELSIFHIIQSEKVVIQSDFSAIDEIFTLKSYLYSIFYNLISNSIKYRRPEVNPVIEISSMLPGDKLRIVFKDNGMGIDLEKKGDQVFGLYKRFHSHVEGKGMGLYMVKTQVQSLGGKINVSSEVNKGTEFTIEFDHKYILQA